MYLSLRNNFHKFLIETTVKRFQNRVSILFMNITCIIMGSYEVFFNIDNQRKYNQYINSQPTLLPLYAPLFPHYINITLPWHHITKCTWGFLRKTPKDPALVSFNMYKFKLIILFKSQAKLMALFWNLIKWSLSISY